MTAGVALDGEWGLVTNTEGDFNVQNQSVEYEMYHVSAAEPAASAVGMVLRPWETHPVFVGTGMSLWGRIREAATGRTGLMVYIPAAEPPA